MGFIKSGDIVLNQLILVSKLFLHLISSHLKLSLGSLLLIINLSKLLFDLTVLGGDSLILDLESLVLAINDSEVLIQLFDLVPVIDHIFLNGIQQFLHIDPLSLVHLILQLILLLLNLVHLIFVVLQRVVGPGNRLLLNGRGLGEKGLFLGIPLFS